jgi:hypothetical protein
VLRPAGPPEQFESSPEPYGRHMSDELGTCDAWWHNRLHAQKADCFRWTAETQQSPPGGTPNRPPENKRCGCGAAIEFGPWHLSDCDRWRRAASRSEHGDPAAQEEEDRHLPDCPDALTKLPKACECPLPAAAEAAQSPQEGAADVDAIRAQAFEEAAALCDSKAVDYRDAGNVDADQAAGLCARRIRDWSERSRAQPAAGPPASESPGPLAALLREARDALSPYYDEGLLARIDAALRESSAERGGEEKP